MEAYFDSAKQLNRSLLHGTAPKLSSLYIMLVNFPFSIITLDKTECY